MVGYGKCSDLLLEAVVPAPTRKDVSYAAPHAQVLTSHGLVL